MTRVAASTCAETSPLPEREGDPTWGGASLYETSIGHTRRGMVNNSFWYRSYHWYVDVDHLPRTRVLWRALAGFDPRDHGAAVDATLRSELDAYLAGHGVDLDGGTITMLAHARVFHHVFNPLTVFWCRRHGAVVCVIAEVHNTYGGRHRYLLRPDEHGRATTPKAFYVSPFNDLDGTYEMLLPEPGEDLDLTVRLTGHGDRPFVATLRGHRLPACRRTLLRLAARHPMAPLVGSARIRWQAVRLWWRGLRVVRRPAPGRYGSGNTRSHRAPRDRRPW